MLSGRQLALTVPLSPLVAKRRRLLLHRLLLLPLDPSWLLSSVVVVVGCQTTPLRIVESLQMEAVEQKEMTAASPRLLLLLQLPPCHRRPVAKKEQKLIQMMAHC